MLTGKDKVIEFIRFNNCNSWRILSSEKGYSLFRFEEKDTATVDDAVHALETVLQNLAPGTYFIKASYPGLNQNSWFNSRFTHGDTNAGIAGFNAFAPMQMQSQLTKDELQAEIAKALEVDRIKRENEQLRKENEQLKSEVESTQHRITKRIEPFLGTLIQAFTPAPAGAIGKIPADDLDTSKEQERLEKAFEKWGKNETEVILLVEKIADMSEKNKMMYKTARNILINS